MAKVEYFQGPPPSLGWWPTQSRGVENGNVTVTALRWWNGVFWSVPVTQAEGYRVSPKTLNGWAEIQTAVPSHRIEWSLRPDSWPLESRT